MASCFVTESSFKGRETCVAVVALPLVVHDVVGVLVVNLWYLDISMMTRAEEDLDMITFKIYNFSNINNTLFITAEGISEIFFSRTPNAVHRIKQRIRRSIDKDIDIKTSFS